MDSSNVRDIKNNKPECQPETSSVPSKSPALYRKSMEKQMLASNHDRFADKNTHGIPEANTWQPQSDLNSDNRLSWGMKNGMVPRNISSNNNAAFISPVPSPSAMSSPFSFNYYDLPSSQNNEMYQSVRTSILNI